MYQLVGGKILQQRYQEALQDSRGNSATILALTLKNHELKTIKSEVPQNPTPTDQGRIRRKTYNADYTLFFKYKDWIIGLVGQDARDYAKEYLQGFSKDAGSKPADESDIENFFKMKNINPSDLPKLEYSEEPS